ncbi:MAG: helix-turn-helix domain-containing protein [Acidimicrobiia bacterium]|nr:helix-turn-helix domain-containing protein [Acidimicrobiia bacterium]
MTRLSAPKGAQTTTIPVAPNGSRQREPIRSAGPRRYAQIPASLLAGDVSDRAIRVYGLLATYADRDGICWPSRERLAQGARCSTDSIDRALRDLETAGMIERVRRGRRLANRYRLLVTDESDSAPVRSHEPGESAPVPTHEPGESAPVRLGESAPVRPEPKATEPTRARPLIDDNTLSKAVDYFGDATAVEQCIERLNAEGISTASIAAALHRAVEARAHGLGLVVTAARDGSWRRDPPPRAVGVRFGRTELST